MVIQFIAIVATFVYLDQVLGLSEESSLVSSLVRSGFLMDSSVADLVSTGETIQIMVDSLNIDAMFIWMLGTRHT